MKEVTTWFSNKDILVFSLTKKYNSEYGYPQRCQKICPLSAGDKRAGTLAAAFIPGQEQIFATLWETEQRALLKLTLELQTTLVASDPDTFALTGWEHQGWTGVQLTNIDLHHFKKLMVTAWKNVAPKRVAVAYDG